MQSRNVEKRLKNLESIILARLTFVLGHVGLVSILQLGLEGLDLVLQVPANLVPLLFAPLEVRFLPETRETSAEDRAGNGLGLDGLGLKISLTVNRNYMELRANETWVEKLIYGAVLFRLFLPLKIKVTQPITTLSTGLQ